MPLSLVSSKRLYSQSGLPDKNQGSNSLVFFFLLPSFKRVVLLTRLGCVRGLRWSSLLVWMSLSGTFNLASRGILAAPPLISNCSALWDSEKAIEAGVLPIRNGRQKASMPRSTQDLVWHQWQQVPHHQGFPNRQRT